MYPVKIQADAAHIKSHSEWSKEFKNELEELLNGVWKFEREFEFGVILYKVDTN